MMISLAFRFLRLFRQYSTLFSASLNCFVHEDRENNFVHLHCWPYTQIFTYQHVRMFVHAIERCSLHNISGIHISHKKVSLLGRGLGEVNAKGKKELKIILSSSELWTYLGVCTWAKGWNFCNFSAHLTWKAHILSYTASVNICSLVGTCLWCWH